MENKFIENKNTKSDIPDIPYKFTPRIYQKRFLKEFFLGEKKRFVWIAHRRSGKDLTCLNAMITKMFQRRGTYFYFFPTFGQGRRDIWTAMDKEGFKMMDHFPPNTIAKKNEQEMSVTLTNGSIFQIIGTNNIDTVVGSNPVGCVFSEYSLQDPKAWNLMRPVLAENGGWAIFNFTPRGLNHGWQILQQAKVEPNWWYEVLSAERTKALDEEVLQQEKRQMPEDLYEQEYNCKFLEGAGMFIKGIDQAVNHEDQMKLDPNHRYQMGVDLAKINDFTVITPIDLMTFKVGKPDRFNQIDYTLQKTKIEAAYYKHHKAHTVIDSTGVGEPIFDDLVNHKIQNIEPFHFTEQSRKDLLNNLKIKIESGIIRLPNDEILIGELKSMRYELSDRGKVKVSVPNGMHDDCIMSLALAVWNLPVEKLVSFADKKAERDLLHQFDHFTQQKGTYKKSGSPYIRKYF